MKLKFNFEILLILMFLSFKMFLCKPMLGLNQTIPMEDGTRRTVGAMLTEFLNDYRKIQQRTSKIEMKRITTAGLLMGIGQVEEKIKQNLAELSKEFYEKFSNLTGEQVLDYLYRLEQIMDRDKKSISILMTTLDLAREIITNEEFGEEISAIGRENELAILKLNQKKSQTKIMRQGKGIKFGNVTVSDEMGLKMELKKKIVDMISSVEMHLKTVHAKVKRQTQDTVKYLYRIEQSTQAKSEELSSDELLLGESKVLLRIRRQDSEMDPKKDGGVISKEDKENEIEASLPEKEKQTEDSESESESEEAPGGLVGLIASLSGGDEGSDVGALIGALSGIVTNLFGPNGLDVESLISTATSLISGLLAGDDNFGKVLGGYVGTAIDGLSGGGGAVNNGQFFGQFIGTLIASLSADPDDDEQPLQPKLFIQNFFSGSKAASSKAGEGEPEEGGQHKPSGGSDVFGFISNIVGSIVAGITSLIVNTSVGSSGGSSQGVADLSGGSSAASSAGSNAKPMHPH